MTDAEKDQRIRELEAFVAFIASRTDNFTVEALAKGYLNALHLVDDLRDRLRILELTNLPQWPVSNKPDDLKAEDCVRQKYGTLTPLERTLCLCGHNRYGHWHFPGGEIGACLSSDCNCKVFSRAEEREEGRRL